MFKVVTVEREYDAGGTSVAQRVAEMLGWSLLDRTLVAAVARTAEVDTEIVARLDEHVDSWWQRFHRGGLRAAAIEAGMPVGDAEFFDSKTVADVAQRVIGCAAAAGNCVIVGRGAQCVLQDRRDVYHVFLYAPWRDRVARARSRLESWRDAGEAIRLSDQKQAGYIQTYHGRNWKDPHLYDIMINSHAGIENAACMIVEGVLRGGPE